MNHAESRLIWYAIFMSETPITPENWISWADARLLKSTDPAPEWLCSLSVAKNYEDAKHAILSNMGSNLGKYSGMSPEELVIGLIVHRHISGEITFEKMWKKLLSVTDIVEFLDSGNWRKYCNKEVNYDTGCSTEGILRRLEPLAVLSCSIKNRLYA